MDQFHKNGSTIRLLENGTRIADRYLIQAALSQGPNSAVYQARDLRFPNVVKQVALKEFYNPSPEPGTRQESLANFERQVNLLAALSHPAIPGILDYYLQDKRAYLVMEFIHGKSLASLSAEPPGMLTPGQVIPWTIALCEVLQYLHAHEPEPIYVLDLNPTNVMLNQHNQILVVDFGLGVYLQDDASLAFRDSPGYIAPEVFQGQVNPSADIYSLGVCLRHLLAGEPALPQEPLAADQAPLQQATSRISADLEQIIHKAVQRDPAARYSSAANLKSDLLGAIDRSDSRQLAPQFDIVAPIPEDKVQPTWTLASNDEIRGTALFNRGVVYFGSYDHYLYAVNADSGKLIWKYQADGGIVSRPAIADDYVFIGSEDYRLHVVSARNGALAWTYYTKGPIHSSPFVAHGHVFIGSDDMSLHAVNIKAGRGIWQIDTLGEIRSTPFVTQEEVYAGNEMGEFYCVDFRGVIKWRYKAKRAITSSAVMADGMVYFCSLDGYVYALDAKSGYLIWRFKMDKGSISSPCIKGNLLFTGAIDGNIYCVNRHSGKEIWRFQTENQVTGSPILLEDELYCGSVDGHLYCLDAQIGKLRWKFDTNKPITGTPALGVDQVFVGSTSNLLYALPAKPFRPMNLG